MKSKLKLLVLLIVISNTTKAQLPAGVSDSTFFYLSDGSQDWYYYQRDVAVFRLAGGAQYTGTLPPFVTSIEWLDNEFHGYNRITFDTSATGAQCQAYQVYLAGYPGFEYGFIPVTRDKDAPADKMQWCMGSDLIAVRFRERKMDDESLAAFMFRHDLTLFHRPDQALPDADTWTWIFQLSKKNAFLPLPACAYIFASEQGYVTMCYPDIQDGRSDTKSKEETKYSCENMPDEFEAWGASAYRDALWNIKNNGYNVNPNVPPYHGIVNADANVCECWNQGYDGTGIKVAVIDNGGTWDYSHPNMLNQVLPGFNFYTYQGFSGSIAQNPSPHGMRVASVIVGLPGTGQISQPHNTTNVGVAYGSKILPYICDLGSVQTPVAIQQAVIDGASIINMSWSSANPNYNQSPVYYEINQASTTGRNGLGVICIASTGNDNADVKNYPAIMKNVIGVGASDPNDYRGSLGSPGGPWDWQGVYPGGGSTFHAYNPSDSLAYDVVAPGTMITTDEKDVTVVPTVYQVQQSGTSFAAPLVAGIAAIFLQKYPNADLNTVTYSLRQNADQVRDGWFPGQAMTYNYHQYPALDGYDKEMFFGRVNCGATISSPVVGLNGASKNIEGIKLAYVNENEAKLLFKSNKGGYTVMMCDISGRQLISQKIEANSQEQLFNTENLKNGLYLFKIIDNNNAYVGTFKYVK